jgi:hypothetical protein
MPNLLFQQYNQDHKLILEKEVPADMALTVALIMNTVSSWSKHSLKGDYLRISLGDKIILSAVHRFGGMLIEQCIDLKELKGLIGNG